MSIYATNLRGLRMTMNLKMSPSVSMFAHANRSPPPLGVRTTNERPRTEYFPSIHLGKLAPYCNNALFHQLTQWEIFIRKYVSTYTQINIAQSARKIAYHATIRDVWLAFLTVNIVLDNETNYILAQVYRLELNTFLGSVS